MEQDGSIMEMGGLPLCLETLFQLLADVSSREADLARVLAVYTGFDLFHRQATLWQAGDDNRAEVAALYRWAGTHMRLLHG